MGNIISNEINIYKDTIGPNISIVSPHNRTLFGTNSPEFEVIIQDFNLVNKWYTINNSSLKLIFIGDIFRINQSLWNLLPNGLIRIQVYANDSLGNISTKFLIIEKKVINPSINNDLIIIFGYTLSIIVLIMVGIKICTIWQKKEFKT